MKVQVVVSEFKEGNVLFIWEAHEAAVALLRDAPRALRKIAARMEAEDRKADAKIRIAR